MLNRSTMIYSDFQGEKISRLGFGAMRLPLRPDGTVDVEQVAAMVDLAIGQGLNYFDTAYPYHGGMSERVMGDVLSRYPREKYLLADKFPGHQISDSYDPAAVFNEQLQKCRVDYFDFYLLHNVCELSLPVYEDERWGIIDYFVEQHRQGRIRHLGLSSHGRPDNLRYVLDKYGDHLEFCQLQVNYLDWTLQQAAEKCALLQERNIPLWVMEPVRGGKLAQLNDQFTARMRSLRPEESTAAWAFRWLQSQTDAAVILSGMSTLEQVRDNLQTFASEKPLSAEEVQLLEEVAASMHDFVPCTSCRYCCEGCPAELDIPLLLRCYNDLQVANSVTIRMAIDALPADKVPASCLHCGACTQVCPQKISVPIIMSDFAKRLEGIKSWKDVCKEREEANRRNSQK